MNTHSDQQLLVSRVKQALIKNNLENGFFFSEISDAEKISQITTNLENVFDILGGQWDHETAAKSPSRIAKMWVKETFSGLNYNNFPELTLVENKVSNDLVIVDNIPFYSTCEHHFQTFQGKCFIAYIPQEKLLGLSKFNRVVNFFSRRPQLQERLTQQIRVALSTVLETENVAVITTATHNCIKCRGVESEYSATNCYAFNKSSSMDAKLTMTDPIFSKIFLQKVNSVINKYPLS